MRRRTAIWLSAGLIGMIGCDESPQLPPPDAPKLPPLASAPATPPEPQCDPRHGGRLLPLADDAGFVEWVEESGTLYLAGPQCEPINTGTDATFLMNTPLGPRFVQVDDCDAAGQEVTCWQIAPSTFDPATSEGVLRFLIEGRPQRVVLPDGATATSSNDPSLDITFQGSHDLPRSP